MTIYWLLFAYPALMALVYPARIERYGYGAGQGLALLGFVVFYTAIGGLRHETGGDWLTYAEMYEEMRLDTLGFALTRTDPIYGAMNWASAQLGTGIYLVNALCCWILGYGVVRVAMTMRDPWLTVLIAVPYLLIVVGLGYVRQGAAIGMVLVAIGSLDRARTLRTIFYLVLATGFHSTAVIAFPLFVFALTRRNRAFALVAAATGAVIYITVLAPRLNTFEIGYVQQEYESSGALTRILMGLLPALLILVRWRAFPASDRVRSVWLGLALANIAALAALVLAPSSTAVDRIALFVSVIQLAAFGEIRALAGMSERGVLLVRLAMIAAAAAVQSVWLIFATHAEFWVPYQSVFSAQ
ncbi:MAG: EpsG family protein [Novosphingobium sp.]